MSTSNKRALPGHHRWPRRDARTRRKPRTPPGSPRMACRYIAFARCSMIRSEYVEQARAARPSPVAKARRSDQAKAKDASRLTEDGLPVHSFRTLLDDLATLAYNVCHTPLNPEARIVMITRPTPVQEKAFRLLNVNPACTQ